MKVQKLDSVRTQQFLDPARLPGELHSLRTILGTIRLLAEAIEKTDEPDFPDRLKDQLGVCFGNIDAEIDLLSDTIQFNRDRLENPDFLKDAKLTLERSNAAAELLFQKGMEAAEAKKQRQENEALRAKSEEQAKQVQTLTNQAAIAAVKIHAEKFDNFRKQNEEHAKFWGWALLLTTAVAIGSLWFEWHMMARDADEATTTIMLLHNAIPRGLIVSVFFFALVFIARNYGARDITKC